MVVRSAPHAASDRVGCRGSELLPLRVGELLALLKQGPDGCIADERVRRAARQLRRGTGREKPASGVVAIDMPFPRTVETREDPRFFELVTELRELLRKRGEHLLPEEVELLEAAE